MKYKFILKGLIKNIPGIENIYNFQKRTGGGTNSARYCYSVWLRHLVFAYKNGQTTIPEKIAELGPGDSLGIGLAALISGAEQYYAFDVVKYFDVSDNLKVFDELVDLFRNKSSIPNNEEFPAVKPILDNHDFPSFILSDQHLQFALNESRLKKIRDSIEALETTNSNMSMISYRTDFGNSPEINNESLDMILSQAVLEHVEDLKSAYKIMDKWLKPNGLISHDIDFKSHGTADAWYGHWNYSDIEWKIVKGRKKFLLNREPYSSHVRLLKESDFKILCEIRTVANEEAKRSFLAQRFKNLTDEDLITQSVFIQAKKERLC